MYQYLYYEAPADEQNLMMISELIEAAINENSPWGESDLDRLYNLLAEKNSEHVAILNYKMHKTIGGYYVQDVIVPARKVFNFLYKPNDLFISDSIDTANRSQAIRNFCLALCLACEADRDFESSAKRLYNHISTFASDKLCKGESVTLESLSSIKGVRKDRELSSIVEFAKKFYSEFDNSASLTSSVDNIELGKNFLFGNITYTVLAVNGTQMLISSKESIAALPYNKYKKDTTWETCDIRTYLNNDYYSSLSSAEKNMIVETTLTNNDNPCFGTNGGTVTKDRIFLLSIEDVLQYMGNFDEYKNHPRRKFIDDDHNSKRVTLYNEKALNWYLRTPGKLKSMVIVVDNWGAINLVGQDVNAGSYGIRPAMWIRQGEV
jgi:hypothetical protein